TRAGPASGAPGISLSATRASSRTNAASSCNAFAFTMAAADSAVRGSTPRAALRVAGTGCVSAAAATSSHLLFFAEKPPKPCIALAGLEAGRRRIVLHDVVVPVDDPERPVWPDLRHDRGRPLIVAGQNVVTVARHPAAALWNQPVDVNEMAGRFAHKGGAVPEI